MVWPVFERFVEPVAPVAAFPLGVAVEFACEVPEPGAVGVDESIGVAVIVGDAFPLEIAVPFSVEVIVGANAVVAGGVTLAE